MTRRSGQSLSLGLSVRLPREPTVHISRGRLPGKMSWLSLVTPRATVPSPGHDSGFSSGTAVASCLPRGVRTPALDAIRLATEAGSENTSMVQTCTGFQPRR